MSKKRPDLVDAEVGRRIRAQRLLSGMSQSELGRQIGVTFQQVQKYENGLNRVGAGRLTKIAKVLGTPVGAFFGAPSDEAGGETGLGSPLDLLAVPGAVRLVQAFGTIPAPDTRRAIVELVEQIAASGDGNDSGDDDRLS